MIRVDCFICGKLGLSNNEVGLNKKLLDSKIVRFYCLDCMANYLEVTTEDLLNKIEDFKVDGCTLFD